MEVLLNTTQASSLVEDLRELETRVPSRRILGIPGVTVSVALNGEDIPLTDTGFITILTDEGRGEMVVKIEAGHSLAGYNRHENGKGVTRLRNHGTDESPEYRTAVNIFRVQGEDNIFAPDYKNTIWLFAADAQGHAHVFTVALVAQDNELFLSYWELYDEQCFRKDTEVVCPGLAKKDNGIWAPVVAELLAGAVEMLPDISAYAAPTQFDASTLPDGVGLVDWFTLRIGIGEVFTKKGKARVYWKQCPKTEDGMRYLKGGERVRFEDIVPRTEGHKPNPPGQVLGLHLVAFTELAK